MPWLLGGKGLPEWLALGDGANNAWFAPVCCAWLSLTYECTRRIGKRFQWEPVQVLQVYRSTQCAIFSGMGLFSMGVLHGQGIALSDQCTNDVFIAAIINFFLWYFVADLFIMCIVMGHYRTDLLIHHGVALSGIISLVYNRLYPCASAPVAVTELISLFSGVEAMLPKPAAWSRGEEHVFYVIRAYRLGVLVLIRPFLWQHVRLSAEGASSAVAAATYLIPGTLLPLLDLTWSWKIAQSLGIVDGVKGFLGMKTKPKGGASEKKLSREKSNTNLMSITSPMVKVDSDSEAAHKD